MLARFAVRVNEAAASSALVRAASPPRGDLERLDFAPARQARRGRRPPVRSGVGIVEGWRGTIVHRVEVDDDGRLTRAKVVDPSWFNWPALPIAMADTIVPDFPVANKSFNLSYAGNDL